MHTDTFSTTEKISTLLGIEAVAPLPARVPVEMLTHYTNLPMEIDFTTMENFTTVEIEIQHCGNWFYHRGKYINTVKLQEYTTFEYNIKCYSPNDKSWICLDSLEFIISTLKNRPNPII